MSEPVRLVIWDLDETFWRGALSEGGVELNPETIAMVMALARRGIVSSICSKNDFDAAKAQLEAAGVWDYFVSPSLDWTAKGPRIRALIEEIGLRPASVMFVDDNPINLAEAAALSPGLQIESEVFIAAMLDDPRFRGKPDPELARLHRYKSLERRKREQLDAGGDVIAFLRLSDIRVSIDHEIVDLERAIELINRANQLNFTKRRLSEDIAAASAQLNAELAAYDARAGLVSVRDAYGDHGASGFYLISNQRLVHFVFSCRLIGLGVERWLYRKLGRPALDIVGEVASDVKAELPPVDWIRWETDATPAPARPNAFAAKRIGLRGGCDLAAIGHYLSLSAPESIGEFNLHRDGADMRIDHSEFLAGDALGAAALAEAAKLGFLPEDFSSALFAGADVWLLSFWSDVAYALYAHKRFGFRLPYPLKGHNLSDARGVDPAALADFDGPAREAYLRRTLPILAADYDYVGPIDEAGFKANLRRILSRAAPQTRIALLTPSAWMIGPDGLGVIVEPSRRLDLWCRAVAAEFPNAWTLNIRDFIVDEAEVVDPYHYRRIVYLRAARFLSRWLESGAWPAQSPGSAHHEAADPEAALGPEASADALARAAAFLAYDHRADIAERLARRALALDSAPVWRHVVLWEAMAARGVKMAEADWRPIADSGVLSAGAWQRLGAVQMRLGAFAEAEAAFRAAAAEAPDELLHRHWLAAALIHLARYDAALAVLAQCQAEGDPDPRLAGLIAAVEAQKRERAG